MVGSVTVTERTVRMLGKTLLAGFTTVRYVLHCFQNITSGSRRLFYTFYSFYISWYRDRGTEGVFNSDIGLRKCLSRRNALIPGPRYYCANRALTSTGSYGEPLYNPSSSLHKLFSTYRTEKYRLSCPGRHQWHKRRRIGRRSGCLRTWSDGAGWCLCCLN